MRPRPFKSELTAISWRHRLPASRPSPRVSRLPKILQQRRLKTDDGNAGDDVAEEDAPHEHELCDGKIGRRGFLLRRCCAPSAGAIGGLHRNRATSDVAPPARRPARRKRRQNRHCNGGPARGDALAHQQRPKPKPMMTVPVASPSCRETTLHGGHRRDIAQPKPLPPTTP